MKFGRHALLSRGWGVLVLLSVRTNYAFGRG